MNGLSSFTQWVDRISTSVGKAVAWFGLLLIAELVYDTVARYAFNAPTAWSYDISCMLYGAFFMLAAPYTLLLDKHVRIEVLYEKVSPKARAVIDLIGYVVFFFPTTVALLYFGTTFALKSWKMLEHTGVSMWSPPVYPFKTIIPMAALLLLMQGIVQCVRCIATITKGTHHDGKP